MSTGTPAKRAVRLKTRKREIAYLVRAWRALALRLNEVRHRLRMHRLSLRPAELRTKLARARTIIFICHGNLFRSPFAAGLLRARVTGSEDIEVLSAGLCTVPGHVADSRAVECAKRFGVDLHSHRTQLVERTQLERADVVFAMEVGHVEPLRRICPDKYHDTYLLGCMDHRDGLEIRDPVDAPFETLEACFVRIEKAVDRILECGHLTVERRDGHRSGGGTA